MRYKNILQIDDDDDDLEIFLAAVKELDRSVNIITLNTTTGALEKLTAKEINPDIIFLDLNMPVLSGQQFLKEIKKDPELKQIPVVIFSTFSDENTIKLTKELGAFHFITKPNKFIDLLNALKPIIG
jgi:CheY-like chemotaxis protein